MVDQADHEPEDNRRDSDRKIVCIPAYVHKVDSPDLVALIRDVSLSGCYLLARRRLAVGDRVEVVLHLTGDPAGPIHEATADVVRCETIDPDRETLWWYGVALRFDVELHDVRQQVEELAKRLALAGEQSAS
jgi:hypothetical protein